MRTRNTRFSLFVTFLRIGAFTFGGGFAMIPLIEREIVVRRKWIDFAEMCDILAISQSFPGVVAINTATIVGYRVSGYAGALLSTLGVVLPSFIIMTAIAVLFTNYLDIGPVQAALKGIGACVIALLIMAAVRVGKDAVKSLLSILIAIAALGLILWAGIHPIYAIIMGLAIGILSYVFGLLRGRK